VFSILLFMILLIEQEIKRSETSFEVQNITYTSPAGDGANVSDGSKYCSFFYFKFLINND